MLYYLAIDPGRDKCGLAIVDEAYLPKKLLAIEIDVFSKQLKALANEFVFEKILLGSGTGKEFFIQIIEAIFPDKEIVIVDERDTTFLAKKLYWQYNQPVGWRKFMPQGLLTVPEPVDAYAALAIALRWFGKI